jgi:hypothetical protein
MASNPKDFSEEKIKRIQDFIQGIQSSMRQGTGSSTSPGVIQGNLAALKIYIEILNPDTEPKVNENAEFMKHMNGLDALITKFVLDDASGSIHLRHDEIVRHVEGLDQALMQMINPVSKETIDAKKKVDLYPVARLLEKDLDSLILDNNGQMTEKDSDFVSFNSLNPTAIELLRDQGKTLHDKFSARVADINKQFSDLSEDITSRHPHFSRKLAVLRNIQELQYLSAENSLITEATPNAPEKLAKIMKKMHEETQKVIKDFIDIAKGPTQTATQKQSKAFADTITKKVQDSAKKLSDHILKTSSELVEIELKQLKDLTASLPKKSEASSAAAKPITAPDTKKLEEIKTKTDKIYANLYYLLDISDLVEKNTKESTAELDKKVKEGLKMVQDIKAKMKDLESHKPFLPSKTTQPHTRTATGAGEQIMGKDLPKDQDENNKSRTETRPPAKK